MNPPGMYSLPADYKRQRPRMFDDFAHDTDVIWQPDVYKLAVLRAHELGSDTIVDVGGGTGAKLVAAAAHGERGLGLVVVETEQACHWLLAHQPEVIPFVADLDSVAVGMELGGLFASMWFRQLSVAPLVVCSDVIEHMEHPDRLASALAAIAGWRPCPVIFSTPERHLTRDGDDLGPCPNMNHAQEWTGPEFVSFLESVGFTIEAHDLTRSNNRDNVPATTLIECSA